MPLVCFNVHSLVCSYSVFCVVSLSWPRLCFFKIIVFLHPYLFRFSVHVCASWMCIGCAWCIPNTNSHTTMVSLTVVAKISCWSYSICWPNRWDDTSCMTYPTSWLLAIWLITITINSYVILLFLLQVEKIIGKLKAQKYGSKILEEIENYELQHPLPSDLVDEGQDGGNRSKKRSKTKNAPVVIESSEDEAWNFWEMPLEVLPLFTFFERKEYLYAFTSIYAELKIFVETSLRSGAS